MTTTAVTMRRVTDATFLNVVANHPDVRPFLGGGDGVLDLSGLVSSLANVTVQGEHGGFIAISQGLGVYDIHSLFLPDGRGREAMTLMREGLGYLFLRTDAVELTTRVPSNNASAKALAQLADFTVRFERFKCWPDIGGPFDVATYGLTIEHWAMKSHACFLAGERFHRDIAQAVTVFGGQMPAHSDDGPAHDHAAGAAYLMCLAGNAMKAEHFYNHWANGAGYEPLRVLSYAPLVIDAGYHVVGELHDGKIEVLSCPSA